MNHRTFTRLLTEGPVQVEVIKNAQIYGYTPGNMFLTNRSTHPYATYPVIPLQRYHLIPGDTLEVLSAHARGTVYGPSCVLVRRGNQEFYVMQTDYKRFVKIV